MKNGIEGWDVLGRVRNQQIARFVTVPSQKKKKFIIIIAFLRTND